MFDKVCFKNTTYHDIQETYTTQVIHETMVYTSVWFLLMKSEVLCSYNQNTRRVIN